MAALSGEVALAIQQVSELMAVPGIDLSSAPGMAAALSRATRLNGVEVQAAPISDLVFDVPALIAYCSTFTELVPGDVIVTGTTGGVGAYRTPPLWMKEGDVVEVEVSGIGVLRNPVKDEVAAKATRAA